MAVRHTSAVGGPALPGTDLTAALEFVRRVSSARDPDDFADETMRGLAALVRCDYVSYVETNPSAGRAMALTEPREAMFDGAPEALARNLDGHPLVRYYAATGELRALKMSDFLTDREFRSTQIYDELFKPADTAYLLSAVLPIAGRVVGFSLHRTSRDFTERDRAIADLLQPHLAQAYERSVLVAAAAAATANADHEEPRVVVLGLDGGLLWMSEDAGRALQRHFGGEATSVLPRAVDEWIAAGCPGPLEAATDGHQLRIDALGERPSGLLLTERATRPSLDAIARLGLSNRESQVLALVAIGKTNAEIARTLTVSPGTVKRHLEHVYEKLDVHTRTAAAAAAWAASEPLRQRVARAGSAVRIV